ncbi:MAG: hypothetical protein AB1894_29210 [Chloroflexota bacterium]
MKRVFIDSSALFSAVYSSRGYARDLLLLGVREQTLLIISSLVKEETTRNLAGFAPETTTLLEHIFEWVPFEVVDPPRHAIIEAANLVALKDAPILAAAKAASVNALVTLDQRHLLDRPELEVFIAAQILRPKEACEWILAEGIG